MKNACKMGIILAALLVTSMAARAWHLDGQVKCLNGVVFKGVEIRVVDLETNLIGSAVTDSDGLYYIQLPDSPGSYIAILNVGTLPNGGSVVGPSEVPIATTDQIYWLTIDWLIDGPACEGACWFTGGGTKIDNILGIPVAEKGLKRSFGGNVNPGCSPTAGDGGNWNHVSRDLKLHFQGKSIRVTDCGNVTPPPDPGSSSPKTPFNYLECVGKGTLKGIQGNKADYGPVTFFARFEDRNEPGSKDANAGALIDRYFLKVVDAGGTTRLLIDQDGVDDTNVDTTEITSGNFQIHVSSCDNPPTL